MDYPTNWIGHRKPSKLPPEIAKHGNIKGLHPVYIPEINAVVMIKNKRKASAVRKRYLELTKHPCK